MAKKKPARKEKELWKDLPEEHDFPAAFSYLSLICGERPAEALVNLLKDAPVERRKAKDLLRASRLPLLPENDYHVALDLKKIADGVPLSPVLLVRGNAAKLLNLTVADGYHRICASYHVDEDQDVRCKIVEPKFV
ncbi:MAG: hypothetical protein EPN30_01315 [Actinomycetota bacterium]|nr:MAG: hypothetical protein EPN30_01315 [Actinomycetota bacterium]